jgi:hypothetical protein
MLKITATVLFLQFSEVMFYIKLSMLKITATDLFYSSVRLCLLVLEAPVLQFHVTVAYWVIRLKISLPFVRQFPENMATLTSHNPMGPVLLLQG